jgi:hypothetical protein
VSAHQANYSKILSLRNTSAALDQQIKDTLILLTDTRRALLDTPSTSFPDSTNAVSYSELLSYARRISKFTLPHAYRETEAGAEGTDATGTPKDGRPESQAGDTSTPAAATNGADRDTQMSGTAMDVDSATPTAAAPSQTQALSQNTALTSTSSTSLPPDFSQFLNPLADSPFIPWPTEEAIRRGALASIQVLLDQNIDPATFDPAKSAELEAERKRLAEEEDRAREEQKVKAEEERRREMERRMSVSGTAAASGREQEKPAVFQLETFDDEEESD